jgi:fructose-1,6-bisphosphatase/inositol monophosphatase family enzyme
MADTNLKPHDILPLLPILKGAGLVIQQFECGDYSNIIACNKEVAGYLF